MDRQGNHLDVISLENNYKHLEVLGEFGETIQFCKAFKSKNKSLPPKMRKYQEKTLSCNFRRSGGTLFHCCINSKVYYANQNHCHASHLVPHHSAFHILSSSLSKSHGEPSYTLMITQIQSKLMILTYSGLQQLLTTLHWGILKSF